MRWMACLAAGLVGLVVAGVQCGGATFIAQPDDDASADGSGGSSGSSGSTSSGSSSGSASGGGSGGSSGTGSGSSSGSTSSGGSSSGGGCTPRCGLGRTCCDAKCVNPTNDPDNCGGCGARCGAGTYCEGGSCKPIPCAKEGGACGNGGTCCGTSCCAAGQLCCESSGPVAALYPMCFTPTSSQPTCPPGCSPLCVSDRNLKRDIEPIDEQAVLERVASIPISTWSYKSDEPTVRHLGPMAQDFHAAFGLGSTDRAYDPIDAHGVELAAIKALYERLQRQEQLLDSLQRENQALQAAHPAPLWCTVER